MKRLFLIPLFVLAALVAGCGGSSDTAGGGSSGGGGGDGETLNLVAYSTPQVVYDEIGPAFAKTEEGSGDQLRASYGASGDQSRAVEAGQKADVVAFSIEGDMRRLVEADLVDPSWSDTPSKGFVATSVVSFVVRKGNPKNIRTWDDLIKPGVKVLTPNPFTSGAAKWNIMAAIGAKGEAGRNPEAGLDYLRTLLTEHVEVQDKSGREALQNFTSNDDADVLLSYENEALTAQKKGEDVDYVIPDDTIKIETPIAVTKEAQSDAQAFVDYALSEPGQEIFASWGYRPVNETVLAANKDKFPDPSGLFTIEDFGGWEKVDEEYFDVENGSVAKIENEAGVSTAK